MVPNDNEPLTNVFRDLFGGWVGGGGPADPLEAVHPELAALFDMTAAEFTFDRFLHAEAEEGWSWISLSFPEAIEGSFHMYCPDSWSEHRQQGPMATLATADQVVRQSCMITTLEPWSASALQMVSRTTLLGFDYRPMAQGFSRWLLVTKGADAYWCWGIYQAGGLVFIIKGDAIDVAELAVQLQALNNSQPWYDWLPA